MLFDGSGFWLASKRLERATFQWPKDEVAVTQMSLAQLRLLLEGFELNSRCGWRRYEQRMSKSPMVIPPSAVQLDPEALLARVRQLESQLKLSEARCARAEYKLQDLLRRIHGPKNEKISPAQWAPFGLSAAAAAAALVRATAKAASTEHQTEEGRWSASSAVRSPCTS